MIRPIGHQGRKLAGTDIVGRHLSQMIVEEEVQGTQAGNLVDAGGGAGCLQAMIPLAEKGQCLPLFVGPWVDLKKVTDKPGSLGAVGIKLETTEIINSVLPIGGDELDHALGAGRMVDVGTDKVRIALVNNQVIGRRQPTRVGVVSLG
jgi:hypothetical protein